MKYRFLKKYLMCTVLMALLSIGALCVAAPSAAQAAEVSLIINGRPVDASQVEIVSGRTLVPLRMVSENLGMTVEWDGEARAVDVRQTDLHLHFVIDKNSYLSNEKELFLDVAPIIVNDRTLVPLRVIGEQLGEVEWQEATRTIIVNSTTQVKDKKPIIHQNQPPTASTALEASDVNVASDQLINEVFFAYLTQGKIRHEFMIENANASEVMAHVRLIFPSSQFLETTPVLSLRENKLTVDLAGGSEKAQQQFQQGYDVVKRVAADIRRQTDDPVKRRVLATDYICQHWHYQFGADAQEPEQYSLYASAVQGKGVCAAVESYATLLFNQLAIPAYRINYYQSEIPLIGHTVTRYLENGSWHYVNFTMLDDRYDRGLGYDFLGNYWRSYDNIGNYRLYSDVPTDAVVQFYLNRFQTA